MKVYKQILKHFHKFNPIDLSNLFEKYTPALSQDITYEEMIVLWYHYCNKYNNGELTVDDNIGEHFRIVMLGEVE